MRVVAVGAAAWLASMVLYARSDFEAHGWVAVAVLIALGTTFVSSDRTG